MLPPAHQIFLKSKATEFTLPRALFGFQIPLGIWCWVDTCGEKAEQARGIVEFEGSSFVEKRALTLFKRVSASPGFAIYISWELGTVVPVHQESVTKWSLDYLQKNHLGILLEIETLEPQT